MCGSIVIPSERSESMNRNRPDTRAIDQDDGDSSTAALRAFARNDSSARYCELEST